MFSVEGGFLSVNLWLDCQGRVTEAIESLLNLEKQHRFAEEISGTKACCRAILEVCFEARDWRLLNEQVVLLSKRRGQLKQV